MPLILIIDDEPAILKILKDSLKDEQFYVETLNDGTRAIDVIGELTPDLILLDIFMPNCNGLELLSQIKKIYPQQKVIIISGYGTIPIALEALKKGALDFFEKPLNLDEILTKLNFLKKKNKIKTTKNNDSQQDFKAFGLIGESPLFFEFMHQITHHARLRYPLLIYGHPGTGKALIARYVHHIFNKGKLPFHLINCSSNQLESLFTSLIEGVIYIKNIDLLPLPLQKKLLAFLESQEYQDKNISGQCKIIASSTQSLFHLCAIHKFIPALFHKLNITPLETIPLNKRRYDIPLFVDHFLAQANRHLAKNISINTASLRILKNHHWKANITELKIFIETLVFQEQDPATIITPEKLQCYFNEKDFSFVDETFFLHFNSLQEATATFEKKFLTYTLKKNRYNLTAVSEKLNINLADLHSKLTQLNIDYDR